MGGNGHNIHLIVLRLFHYISRVKWHLKREKESWNVATIKRRNPEKLVKEEAVAAMESKKDYFHLQV